MSMTNLANNIQTASTVTAIKVPNYQRMDIFPLLFGARHIKGEALIYGHMRKFCTAYNGGHWVIFRLSNGGAYLRPDMETARMGVTSNYFDAEISGDAAGIIVTLYALNVLMWEASGNDNEVLLQRLTNNYDWLKDYASEHSERGFIYRAID
nr:antirestriction protein klcA [Yersinia pseudotuberculosis]